MLSGVALEVSSTFASHLLSRPGVSLSDHQCGRDIWRLPASKTMQTIPLALGIICPSIGNPDALRPLDCPVMFRALVAS